MTTIKLVGTYRVVVSDDELRFITEEVTGSEERTQEIVGGLALLEVEVCGAPPDFAVGRIQQAASGQAAYDERYFSLDGSQLLGSDRPHETDFRVCFFLHHFDPAAPVVSPYGELASAGLQEMPEWLAEVCIYEHPG